jgi:hypothetical protein
MPLFPLEVGLTAALWDLFAHSGVPSTVDVMIRQLDQDDPRVRNFKARRAHSGSGAWFPRRSPGADLAIISPDDESQIADVLAFIEVKAAAQTNWPDRTTAERLAPLNDAVATAILQDYAVGPLSTSSSICQADVYRSRKWWSDSDGVRVEDANEVLWLLLDSRGRHPKEAFRHASRSDAWLTIDLHVFARDLREYRSGTDLSEGERDIIAVVLWHIDQSPHRSETTEPNVQSDERPKLSELIVSESDITDAAPSAKQSD